MYIVSMLHICVYIIQQTNYIFMFIFIYILTWELSLLSKGL